jgi:Ni/Fe-hydrogenase subunit HybB-like protein
MSDDARPIGGRILTPFFSVLVLLAGVMAALVLYRIFSGVGSITALTDGYSWGIWKPINVVTFTGIGAGAYAVGLLTYILNKGKFHPLIRPAVLVGALGYTLGGTSVIVDLGRWWGSVFLGFPPWYNLNSILLEVALCVITYMAVLWVEVIPAALERIKADGTPAWQAFAAKWLPRVRRMLPFIIALAMLLPTMHQSSLGGLYMMAPTKEHALWFTGWLPFLFLTSCLTMGYGSVVFMDILLGVSFHGKYRTHMKLLGDLAKVAAWVTLFYVVFRFAALGWEGKLGYAFEMSGPVPFFWLEMFLFLLSAVMYLTPSVRANRGRLFLAGLVGILAGAAYRVDTYLTAYDPGPGWHYFPSVGEVVVTVGLASVGVAVFILLVRILPILALGADAGAPSHSSRPTQ